jgi:hypothetical protein
MGYTGRVIYKTLVEYNSATGEPTGVTKPNVSSDPDYIPPFYDENACPTTQDTITLSTNFIYYDYNGGDTEITVTADSPWSVTPEPGISITPTSGNSGSTLVTISTLTRNEPTDVNYYIDFVLDSGNDTSELNIFQEGNDTGQFQ